MLCIEVSRQGNSVQRRWKTFRPSWLSGAQPAQTKGVVSACVAPRRVSSFGGVEKMRLKNLEVEPNGSKLRPDLGQ